MGLVLYLVGDVPRIQNKGKGTEMRVGSHLTGGGVALLFPNKMKKDDNEKGDTRFDHQ